MPFIRRASSRASSPLKIRLSPQEISEVNMENSAIIAIAPRPLFGIPAKARIRRFTTGVVATTYPPMMIITICMVNGTRVQKFLAPWMASLLADSWRHSPKMKTMTIPASAKTRGSGNQRSLQVARANPKRAKPLSCWAEFVLRPDDTGSDGIASSLACLIEGQFNAGLQRSRDRQRDYHLGSSHRQENEESTC